MIGPSHVESVRAMGWRQARGARNQYLIHIDTMATMRPKH